MPRVLILAKTTGYQTRAFGDAAARAGVELVFATDRCHMLDDPWQDGAVPIRFHEEAASVDALVEAAHSRPFDGILAVGDRPTLIAAQVAERLGIPGNPPAAAAAARNKRLFREQLRGAGLLAPSFVVASLDVDPRALVRSVSFPAVLKPAALSGSRGVMRVDDAAGLRAGLARLRALLQSPDVVTERDPAHRVIIVEDFIPGREFAVEGLMHHGECHLLAIFDKPDPLDGPFFEETIYVTPSTASTESQTAIHAAVARAAAAIGLHHGPIHAECRVNDRGVFVLEIAARPIGGLCARAVRIDGGGERMPLEEALLRHACGESPEAWTREADASGVMMIPIPGRGVFRGVDGVDEALAVDHVEEVRITAKIDQRLVPLPEGASYLGFIFARASSPHAVERALRSAHGRLRFTIDPELPVLQSQHG